MPKNTSSATTNTTNTTTNNSTNTNNTTAAATANTTPNNTAATTATVVTPNTATTPTTPTPTATTPTFNKCDCGGNYNNLKHWYTLKHQTYLLTLNPIEKLEKERNFNSNNSNNGINSNINTGLNNENSHNNNNNIVPSLSSKLDDKSKNKPFNLLPQVIECICGANYRFDKRSTHNSTAQHVTWITANPQEWLKYEEDRLNRKKLEYNNSTLQRKENKKRFMLLNTANNMLPSSMTSVGLTMPLVKDELPEQALNAEFRCACGGQYILKNRSIHYRSQQHTYFINSSLFKQLTAQQQLQLLETDHIANEHGPNFIPLALGDDEKDKTCECGGSKKSRNHWYSLKHQIYLQKGNPSTLLKSDNDDNTGNKRKHPDSMNDDDLHNSKKTKRLNLSGVVLSASTLRCLARSKAYKEANRELIRTKSHATIDCVCGHSYRAMARTVHNRCAHHLTYTKNHPDEVAAFEKEQAVLKEERYRSGIRQRLESRRKKQTVASTGLPVLDPDSPEGISLHYDNPVRYVCPCGGIYSGRSRFIHLNSVAHKHYVDTHPATVAPSNSNIPELLVGGIGMPLNHNILSLPSQSSTFSCACGGVYDYINRFRHFHSQKHQYYIGSSEFNQLSTILDSAASLNNLFGGIVPPTGDATAPINSFSISKYLASLDGMTSLTSSLVKSFFRDPSTENSGAILSGLPPINLPPLNSIGINIPSNSTQTPDVNANKNVHTSDSNGESTKSRASAKNRWCHNRTTRHLNFLSGSLQQDANSQPVETQTRSHSQMTQSQVQSQIPLPIAPPHLESISLGSSTFSNIPSRLFSSMNLPPPNAVTSANSFLQTQFPALFQVPASANISLPSFDPSAMQLDNSFNSLMTRAGSAFQTVDNLQVSNSEQNH